MEPRAGVGLTFMAKVPVCRPRRSFNCAHFCLIRKKIYTILAPPLNIHSLKSFVKQTHFLNLCNRPGTFQTTKDEARAKACNLLFYLVSHHMLALEEKRWGDFGIFLFCFVFLRGGGRDFVFWLNLLESFYSYLRVIQQTQRPKEWNSLSCNFLNTRVERECAGRRSCWDVSRRKKIVWCL